MHRLQSMHTLLSILISDSLTSIQSTGQTEIQVLQKSHLFSIILIINKKCRVMFIKSMPIIILANVEHNQG